MLSTKERSIIQKIQNKERDQTGKFIQKKIIESSARVHIIAKLHALTVEVAQANGLSYEETVEILKNYVNE